MHETAEDEQFQADLTSESEAAFHRWEPASGPGMTYGLLFITLNVLFVLLFLVLSLISDGLLRLLLGLTTFLGVVAIFVLLILVSRLRSLGYVLNTHDLIVEIAGRRRHLKYADITSVVFDEGSGFSFEAYERFWPGFYVSSHEVDGEKWYSVATLPPGQRIRVHTRRAVVAISPEHPVLFLQELETRRQAAVEGPAMTVPGGNATSHDEYQAELGPAAAVETSVSVLDSPQSDDRSGSWIHQIKRMFFHNVLGDSIASNLIAAGVIMLVLMTVYSIWRIDGSYSGGPIHWNARGEPDVFVSARGGWIFVLIAGTVLIINTALAMLCTLWDQFLTRLLLASTIAIQVLLSIALLSAVS